MEPPQSNQIPLFESGVKMEERCFQWRIQNFHVVLMHDSLIDTHVMEFSAGESIGLASKWSVNLFSEEIDEKNWAGIFLVLRKRPTLESQFLFANCAFAVKNKAGGDIFFCDVGCTDMYSLRKDRDVSGWGFRQFIARDENAEWLMDGDNTLTIHVTFKLYFPSMSVVTPSLEATIANFMSESPRKAKVDLAGLQKLKTLTDIKIVSSDRKSFAVKKEIISARSPVFEAMLKSNMMEGNEGIIRIPDMRSKSLRVLLNYISDGGLGKDWIKSEVLVELTNAAAKYQLPELLNFLDGVAGKVCDADNAGPLMILANRLPLKQAEKDLLSFVRINGTGSAKNFIKILKAVSPTTEEASPGVLRAVAAGEEMSGSGDSASK